MMDIKKIVIGGFVTAKGSRDATVYKVMGKAGSSVQLSDGRSPGIFTMGCSLLKAATEKQVTESIFRSIAAIARSKAAEHPIVSAVNAMGKINGFEPSAQTDFANDLNGSPVVRVKIYKPMGDIALWMEFHANARPSFAVDLLRKTISALGAYRVIRGS